MMIFAESLRKRLYQRKLQGLGTAIRARTLEWLIGFLRPIDVYNQGHLHPHFQKLNHLRIENLHPR